MAVVSFDAAAFVSAYPAFTNIPVPQLTAAFSQATYFCNNTDNSIITDLAERASLLWLLTAHITQILYGLNDGVNPPEPPTGVVGRVQIAKEGTVHAMLDMGATSPGAAWFNQTPYGAMYWAMTMKYRSFRYAPGTPPYSSFSGVVRGDLCT